MTSEELEKRRQRAETEPLVIARTDAGFRVHSPTRGGTPYVVAGPSGAPTCTCPDFTYHADDPTWRCDDLGSRSRTVESADRKLRRR